MKKAGIGKTLLVLCIAAAFAFSMAGCEERVNTTLLALNSEYSSLEIAESNGAISLDISLSDQLDSTLSDKVRQVMDIFKKSTYTMRADSKNFVGDMTFSSSDGELIRLILDEPGKAYYFDMTGLLEAMKKLNVDYVSDWEADLQGNQWIKFDLTDDASLEFDQKRLAVARELTADYCAGLENEVFADFDSGLVTEISGGFQFKLSYEQLGPYIQAIGGYTLENLDAFCAYTKTFIQNLTGEQLSSLELTEANREEIITMLAELATPENKALYENILAMAVSYIQMPDVSKILAGSYIDVQLARKGDTFTWKYDISINANFEEISTLSGIGMDLGNNSVHLTGNETTKEIGSFNVDPPSSFIKAEDTEYFAEMASFFNPFSLANPYGDLLD
jgi:hypothetical protein